MSAETIESAATDADAAPLDLLLTRYGRCIGCLSQICQKAIDSSSHRSTATARM